MRWENVYIAATASSVPGNRVPVQQAVNDGSYSAELAQRTQQRAVAVADPDTPAVDFAVRAAFLALSAAQVQSDEVEYHSHTAVLDAGPRVWQIASYVERELEIPSGAVIAGQVSSVCNGLLPLEHACNHLAARLDDGAALLTFADVWAAQDINRWKIDPDLPMGDGGAAVVLTRETGHARVLSTATYIAPGLEAWHRGKRKPGQAGESVSFKDRAQGFYDQHGITRDKAWDMHSNVVRRSVDAALRDAGTTRENIRVVVIPHNGLSALQSHYLAPLGFTIRDTTWELEGRDVGHMGGSDVWAAYSQLRTSGTLRNGDRVLLWAEGVGYVCSAAVLEVVNP